MQQAEVVAHGDGAARLRWRRREQRQRALEGGLRTIEVHISNVYKREEFRHHSFLAPVCTAVISGLGFEGYHAAVRFLLKG